MGVSFISLLASSLAIAGAAPEVPAAAFRAPDAPQSAQVGAMHSLPSRSPPAAIPHCLATKAADGRWTSPPMELCDPNGGCSLFDPSIALVGGCLGLPASPPAYTLKKTAIEAGEIRALYASEKECNADVQLKWMLRKDATKDVHIVVNVTQLQTCGPRPRPRRPLQLRRSRLKAGSTTALLDAKEPTTARAALEAALRRQSNPAICAKLEKMLETDRRPLVRRRILQAANEPCLVDALIATFIDDERESPHADAALARMVESPNDRFRLLLEATHAGRVAPALLASLVRPLSSTQIDRLVDPAFLNQASPEVATATLEHLRRGLSPESAATLVVDLMPAFSTSTVNAFLEHEDIRQALAKRPPNAFDQRTEKGDRKALSFGQLLIARLADRRSLNAANWQTLTTALEAYPSLRSSFELALVCRTDDASPVEIPPQQGRVLLTLGLTLSCAAPAPVSDFEAIDPTDFDAFSDDTQKHPLGTGRHLAAVDAPKAPQDPSDAAEVLAKPATETGESDGSTKGRDDEEGKDEEEETKSMRERFFAGGFSVAPFLTTSAFFQGPMAGGGLMGSWHITDRFSVVGLASAAFTCTVCLEETTGSRTDLRLDAGLSVNLLPHLDVTPYSRLTVGAAHIEIIDLRRASFHDAIGPELTVGIDWLPLVGARFFLEAGAFWLFEVTRSVRPDGQVAPSPRGVPPVDGSTFGVAARLGMTLSL